MSTSFEPPHPDDVPHLIELRKHLYDAFLTAKRRYELSGLDATESREHAEDFILAVLNKQVALDVEPDVENASLGELWQFLLRQKPSVLWGALLSLIALVAFAFSLGAWPASG